MRTAKLGAVKFRSRTAKALWYLKNTSKSETEIAKICHVSIPCVCQALYSATGIR